MVAWTWPRGKPLLAAYEGFKLSKAQLQRSRFHAAAKLGLPYEESTPPQGEEDRDASSACSGDS